MRVVYNDIVEHKLLVACSDACVQRDIDENNAPWMQCYECKGYFLDGDEAARYGDVDSEYHFICSDVCDKNYEHRALFL